jgi:hypothetical protein
MWRRVRGVNRSEGNGTVSKFDMDDPFNYEGRFCWVVAGALGAASLAFWAAVACLIWRGVAELGWLNFNHGGAIVMMAFGIGFGALIGVLEHADRHQLARYLAAHPEAARIESADEPSDDEQRSADRDEQQPAGGAR